MSFCMPAPRPTGSRVHRHTKTLVGAEGAWFRPLPKRQRALLITAAEKFDRLGRLGHRTARDRRKIGHLGPVALEVLRLLLFRYHCRKTGRLDPSLETLARAAGHSIAGVHAALKRLRQHGFLAWLRRYRPTDGEGLRGPQVEQASNAYQLLVPRKLQRGVEGAPVPACEAEHHRAAVADRKRMEDGLALEDLPGEIISDPGLAAVLARLGRAVEAAERGSNHAHETQPKSEG